MRSEKIEVVAYAGYRDEERPSAFLLQGETVRVTGILNMWLEEGADRGRRRFFKVLGSNGRKYTLYYHEQFKDWHLTAVEA